MLQHTYQTVSIRLTMQGWLFAYIKQNISPLQQAHIH